MKSEEFPIPARINIAIVVAQLVCFVAIFYGASYATSAREIFALAVAFAILGNSIYSVIHEAEHCMLHPNRTVNDALGVVMALLFPAPYHLLRHGHLAHHRFNRSDHEAFDLYFDGDSPPVKWAKFYGIITGIYWITVVLANFVVVLFPFLLRRQHFEFDRHMAEFVESLEDRNWTAIRLEGLCAIALHLFIPLAMGIEPLTYFLIYFGFGFSWSAMQYVHHFGTERHVLNGSRNLWLFAPIDVIWLHHNWHLTHHKKPTVPWIYLPQLGREEDPHREFLIPHYLRMWRGPRYTAERVKTRFAGKVAK